MTIAGGQTLPAIRLALSMLCLQVSIGALNDLADSQLDGVSKPGKPIPSGLASPRLALEIAVGGLVAGIGLSLVSGPLVAGVAVLGVSMGFAYDLWLSRTRFSWLPLAVALPLLPIHAWLGATGRVPAGLLSLIPVAVLAGAGLALANGLVDLERDQRAGRTSLVASLGRRRAWAADALVMAMVILLVVLLAPVPSPPVGQGSGVAATLQQVLILAAVPVIVAGAALLSRERPAIRERGWELQALGVAGLGIGWLAGLARP